MLNIAPINNTLNIKNFQKKADSIKPEQSKIPCAQNLKYADSSALKAYHPSFCAKTKQTAQTTQNSEVAQATDQLPSKKEQLKIISSKLDKETISLLKSLDKAGILDDKSSNDGSSVVDNLYKTATEPRIQGLDSARIIKEIIRAIANPASITQKFGDIPDEVANAISQETGKEFPQTAKNVISSCCVTASMEYNLASRTPAEFARFAADLSSQNYSVTKNVKMSDIADGTAAGLFMLREFNTENKIHSDWENVSVNIKPDRNAIVRARVQASYQDPGERSCIDVLIQSALLNLGSQNSYDALTDERTGKFNPEKTGLTDFEKNFVEEIVFATPKISVVYQTIDDNGYLTGYNCRPEETKAHILKSLQLGQNVIIGYTHIDENNQVQGGHEITITDYKTDKNGNGIFICNDTDDEIDSEIEIEESKLLPLIHHAGISKEALSSEDTVVESWREILDDFKGVTPQNNNQNIN